MSKHLELIWKCHYDGNRCQRTMVNVVNGNVLVPPTLDEKPEYWEMCETCKRNYSLSGHCYGTLAIAGTGKGL